MQKQLQTLITMLTKQR